MIELLQAPSTFSKFSTSNTHFLWYEGYKEDLPKESFCDLILRKLVLAL